MVSTVVKWSILLALFYRIPMFTSGESAKAIAPKSHPFYVSVVEINHNTSESSLEISCKMFADDFENTLKNQFKTNIDLTHPKDSKLLDRQVFEYLQKNLQVNINGKSAPYAFVGFEKESEAAWCYLEVKQVPSVKNLELTNTLLYESYPSQISIMHVLVKGSRKTTRLTNPENKANFSF